MWLKRVRLVIHIDNEVLVAKWRVKIISQKFSYNTKNWED